MVPNPEAWARPTVAQAIFFGFSQDPPNDVQRLIRDRRPKPVVAMHAPNVVSIDLADRYRSECFDHDTDGPAIAYDGVVGQLAIGMLGFSFS
jgi:hypothetical protein